MRLNERKQKEVSVNKKDKKKNVRENISSGKKKEIFQRNV